MQRRLTTFGILAVGLLVWTSVAEAKPKTAVLGIETRGAQDPQLVLVGQLMTKKLRTEVAKPGSPYDLSRVMEDFLTIKIMHDCPGGAYPCMSRITKQVPKATRAIYGTVAKDPRGYVFQLTLLNAETAQPEGTLTEVVPLTDAPDGNKAGVWARTFYDQLLGRAREGKLVIRSNVDSGEVFVDGKSVGDLSEGVVVVNNVEPGDRVVSVDSGGQTAKATVKVVEGQTSEVELTVVKGTTGPGPGSGGGSTTGWKVGFYSGVVLAVAGGVFGVIQQNRLSGLADDVEVANDALTPPLSHPTDVCKATGINEPGSSSVKDKCDDGKTAVYLRNTGYAVGGIAAAAAIYFAYKAFFSGNGSSSERDDLSSRRKRKQPRVRVLPGGPGDIGAGLEVTF